ncbi:signal peptide peptidase SppA [Thermus tengchongensis]|uniref:Signal peptide peptidase SppA n=1 Tax=Thermus tengchongensis TaxID=1214928 RepID=A0A4Y9FA47_9DEIN|nr:signal peptide peptidase SppA [Thermus tengchongensis]TFU16847.1 signal peptide peptidase SppA [Thermus tengchongensis]TFU25423.1 signal peptide peptidase SppA [Thermus tengchongensis]
MNRKRWLALLLFVMVAFLVVGLGRLIQPREAGHPWQEATLYGRGEKVVLLEVVGSIPTGKELENLLSKIRQAREDPGIRAAVLFVDSPGGSVTETEAIHRALKGLARDKPLVAAFGTVAASGGYYVATAAREIFTPATAITGSIGVIAALPQVQGLLAKLGVQVEVLKEGRLKDMGSGLRPLTPEERTLIQGYMREAYELFVARVAEGRHLPKDKVRQLADGRIYSGTQAIALGLADREGYLEDAAKRAAELAGLEEFRLVRYVKPKGLLDGLLGEGFPLGLSSETEQLISLLGQNRLRLEYRYLGGGLW